MLRPYHRHDDMPYAQTQEVEGMTGSADDFGRLITAMVTPFDEHEALDYQQAGRLAQRLVKNGTDSIVVSGTTGESPTLSTEEKIRLFRTVRDAVAGQAKVIGGTTNYNTRESIELTEEAAAYVDGYLLVVPYYNNPPQEGLYRHFRAIAESTDQPCILYNVPTRTVRNMEADTVVRLSEVPNIVGVKGSVRRLRADRQHHQRHARGLPRVERERPGYLQHHVPGRLRRRVGRQPRHRPPHQADDRGDGQR